MALKVLFSDSWTRGIHNFLPLHDELAKQGVESLLVHRGSWGSEPGRAEEEELQGLLCRDIRYYRTNLLYEVFAREQPDLLLTLNTNYIFDRALILAGRALGIQTAFLMHGILDVERDVEALDQMAGKILRSRRWQRVGKYARFVLPNYLYSGVRTNLLFPLRREPYQVVWNTFRHPERYLYYPDPSKEMQCDRALVWGRAYGKHVQEIFGYPPEHVVVVGHPPLDRVFQRRSAPPGPGERADVWRQLGLSSWQKYCVLLESPFVEQGVEGWTREVRDARFRELVDIAHQAGLALVIKLHPSSTFEAGTFDGDPRVRVRRQADLPQLIDYAESVIAYMSSTILIAVALGKQVYSPSWSDPSRGRGGFSAHGVTRDCATPAELLSALKGAQDGSGDSAARERYVNEYITYTDGRSIERIVGSCVEQAEISARRKRGSA